MAIDNDESISLPKPPPPRPARREAAIEAALRKFDGTDKGSSVDADREAISRPSLTWWARTHRPQFGVLVSAALIAVIGIPAALIAIRDQPPMQERSPPAVIKPDRGYEIAPSQAQSVEPSDTLVVKTPPSSEKLSAPPVRAERSNDFASAENYQRTEETAASPLVAATPSPPAPPPPPAASPEKVAETPGASNVIVTGTRIPKPAISTVSDELSERSASGAAQRVTTSNAARAGDRKEQDSTRAFLARLQAAVRVNDRRAVINLIDFPLRVNSKGRTRIYRDAQSVERDYGRIFTPEVRRAILRQRFDQLFSRDQGTMIGDGEVWFDQTCSNAECSPAGPIRIKAINL